MAPVGGVGGLGSGCEALWPAQAGLGGLKGVPPFWCFWRKPFLISLARLFE